MNAPAMNTDCIDLVAGWGFSGHITKQLSEHANNVLRLGNLKTGEIVVKMGLASQEIVDNLLRTKPVDAKTLEWFQSNDIRQVFNHYDEITAIQNKRAWLSEDVPGIKVYKFDGLAGTDAAIEKEISDLDVLLMEFQGTVLFAFSELSKLLRFQTLDRDFREKSRLFRAIRASGINLDPRKHILVANSLLMSYRASSNDNGLHTDDDESIQTIDQSMADGNESFKWIIGVLNEALKNDVNDIAFRPMPSTGEILIYFRRFQRLHKTEFVLRGAMKSEALNILTTRSRANISGGRLQHPADGNLNFNGKNGAAFIRLSFIPLEKSRGEQISTSLRLLPKEERSVTLESLNIPKEIIEELQDYSIRERGLILVCGPTNSGKSTTIAGMLDYNYKTYGHSKKRISVEQPCERLMSGVDHIDVSHYVFKKEGSFTLNPISHTLKYILRHDPDVIFIGEIRDKETSELTVDASNTGHLALSTTHANSPVLGYRRVASFLPENRHFDLVSVLNVILAQRLVNTLCKSCKKIIPFTEVEERILDRYTQENGINTRLLKMPKFYAARCVDGCDKCINGYSGMLPVHGMLKFNPEVRRLLLSKDEQDWLKVEHANGSEHTLFSSAFKLFIAQTIDLDSLKL